MFRWLTPTGPWQAEVGAVARFPAGRPTTVEVEGIPGMSATWYRDLVDFAHGTPGWVHWLAEIGTEALPILLVVVLAVNWWRSRGLDAATTAQAFLAPFATATSYLISNVAKSIIHQDRPCQAIEVLPISPCPPMGDWSFPSNHTTFAAAAAVGLAIAWRRTALWVLVAAVLTAFSRVFVGAHYPHDVAVGLLLGAAVAAVILIAGLRPTTRLVEWAEGVPALRWAVAEGPLIPSGRDSDEDERSEDHASPPMRRGPAVVTSPADSATVRLPVPARGPAPGGPGDRSPAMSGARPGPASTGAEAPTTVHPRAGTAAVGSDPQATAVLGATQHRRRPPGSASRRPASHRSGPAEADVAGAGAAPRAGAVPEPATIQAAVGQAQTGRPTTDRGPTERAQAGQGTTELGATEQLPAPQPTGRLTPQAPGRAAPPGAAPRRPASRPPSAQPHAAGQPARRGPDGRPPTRPEPRPEAEGGEHITPVRRPR
ncbi:phosphatase PAP2 family protein [Actinoalloteichus sp. GBA129-24]|uniref:phosphatase PAP2 family protein n=1 Tax=Actinoalloteichus sp. GBA129-24 TaxID=1612551 RepID=UPI0009507E5D|nr:phosphatase PAP2 family protein [Actinoalloteichus sp. GBA129-24]APU20068.1 PAP2 superfamily protein [Actinoalloteichus sp. GBA129-24]